MAENSITHQRRSVFYPTPKNNILLLGYISKHGAGLSETVNTALKDFFMSMPPEERLTLLKYGQEALKKPDK